MYNKKMYARKNWGIFLHIHDALERVKIYGSGPYFKINVREVKKGENSPYWAWKDFKEKKYRHIKSSKIQTEMCDPKLEIREEEGEGKLVNLVIGKVRKIKNP